MGHYELEMTKIKELLPDITVVMLCVHTHYSGQSRPSVRPSVRKFPVSKQYCHWRNGESNTVFCDVNRVAFWWMCTDVSEKPATKAPHPKRQ
jgi:hypothetical protein